MFEVLKPFTTTNRRVKVGERVYRGDNLSPHTIDALVSAGYVVNRLTEKGEASKKQKSIQPNLTPENQDV